MTFEVNDGKGVVSCDTCSEQFIHDEADFHETLEAAQVAGWKAYKGPDKQWAHSCPACVADFAKEQRR